MQILSLIPISFIFQQYVALLALKSHRLYLVYSNVAVCWCAPSQKQDEQRLSLAISIPPSVLWFGN